MKTNRLLDKNVVSTYASVLLDAAQAENRVFEDVRALELVAFTIRAHSELHEALCSKELTSAARADLVKDVFAESTTPEVLSVVSVMAERGDIDLIGRVVSSFREAAEHELNVVVAEVTTVVPLDDHLRQIICDKLASETGKQVHLEEKVDPSIIGGVIINAQGKRIDASIRTQLMNARAVLSKNVSIGGEA